MYNIPHSFHHVSRPSVASARRNLPASTSSAGMGASAYAHEHGPRGLPQPPSALLSSSTRRQPAARSSELAHCLPRTTSSSSTPLPASSHTVQAGRQPAQPAPQQTPPGRRFRQKRRRKRAPKNRLGRLTKAQLLVAIEEELGHAHHVPMTESEFQYLPPVSFVHYMVASLRDQFGVDATLNLLRSSVRVLAAGPPSEFHTKLDAVAAACGCDQAGALELCTRKRYFARLLFYTPQRIQLVFAAVRECLGLGSAQELREACLRCSRLLAVAPDVLHARHEVLGSLLQLEGDALALVLRRRPALLWRTTADAAELRERHAALGDLLQLDNAALARLLRRQPTLLYSSRSRVEMLRARHNALASLLQLDDDALALLLRRQPGLLCNEAAEAAVLSERHAALGALLQLEDDALAKLLRRRPMLLCSRKSRVEVLRARHAALGKLLQLDGDALVQLLRRRPALLWTDTAQVGAALEAVQAALELGSREEAVRVATRNPDLLVNDPKFIPGAVRWMKRRLGLSSADVKQCTVVLKKRVSSIEAAWQQLPQALGVTPAEARQLVVEAPDLLYKGGSSLAATWAELRRAAGLQQAWREELLAATPSILIRCLGTRAQRLSERLQAVTDAELPQGQLPALLGLAKLNEDDFAAAMVKLRRGSYRVLRTPRQLKPTSLAVLFPSLAAQLD